MVGSARWSVYPWSVIMCTAEMACVSVCALTESINIFPQYVRPSFMHILRGACVYSCSHRWTFHPRMQPCVLPVTHGWDVA